MLVYYFSSLHKLLGGVQLPYRLVIIRAKKIVPFFFAYVLAGIACTAHLNLCKDLLSERTTSKNTTRERGVLADAVGYICYVTCPPPKERETRRQYNYVAGSCRFSRA